MNSNGIKEMIAITTVVIAAMCVGLTAIAATVKFIQVFIL